MKEKRREEDFFPSIERIEEEMDLENIPLIEYPSREEEILRDLRIQDPETDEEINVSKIYQNELELTEEERLFEDQTTRHVAIPLHFELNSDVGNDICLENIKKIHKYLSDDAQAEATLQQEIQKTKEYTKTHSNNKGKAKGREGDLQ